MRFRRGRRTPRAAVHAASPAASPAASNSAPQVGGSPRLSCETVERLHERLHERLYSGGATSAAADAHRRGCEECRRDAAEGLPIRRLLAPLALPVTPDPLFVPAVLAQIRAEPSPLRRLELRGRAMKIGRASCRERV